MINRDGLIHLFRRVLMVATYTKPYSDWNDAVQRVVGQMADRIDLDHAGVICYFESEDRWFLVALDELVWRERDGSVYHLAISNLNAARIDLRVNRDYGFVPGKGFGVLTLTTVGDVDHHVMMESGSAAEAVLRVVTELLRQNTNF
jgi:hypothetical protein